MNGKPWTNDEDLRLTNAWGNMTIAKMCEEIPERSWSAIRNRANALVLGKNKKHFKTLSFDEEICEAVKKVATNHNQNASYICNRIHYLNRIGKLK